MWIFLLPGEKASRRPVTRSSKRAPTQIMTSQSCMALLASKRAVHAQHAQPGRVGGREGAQAHQGRGDRRAGQGANSRSSLAEAFAGRR
jgi:hypothetical protein